MGNNIKREIRGIILLALAVLLCLALVSYDRLDPSWNVSSHRVQVENYIGPFGAYVADLLIILFGLASFCLPLALLILAINDFRLRAVDAVYTKTLGALILIPSVCGLLEMTLSTWPLHSTLQDGTIRTFSAPAGGWLGSALTLTLEQSVGDIGGLLILITGLLLSMLLLIRVSLGRIFATAGLQISSSIRSMRTGVRKKMDSQARIRERKKVIQKHIERIENQTEIADVTKKNEKRTKKRPVTQTGGKEQTEIVEQPVQLDFRDMAGDNFILPPQTLLEAPTGEVGVDKKELQEKSHVITDKLAEFAVAGTVTEIHPGPIVTTYEFKPEAGVKYSKIVGMCNDLSLALKAESIRIDRLAGQATVGVEVPNEVRETIFLREIVGSHEFQQSPSLLTLGLGKLIHGEVYVSDLMKMPHLLIAGSTNSGKSVAINAMLCSILYKATPDEVKLILIDPKRLELNLYEDIPHLLVPVVVEPKLASNALKWAVSEMEDRYRLLASFNVRNIAQFNQAFLDEELQANLTDEQRKQLKPLSYIVIVIDELADLMITCGNDVEESIQRLAQMARAVGIHLIVATQRPSVDVITGIIKANFPCRISFRMPSGHDSKTILDSKGAEQLLGMGDMLFIAPMSARLTRVHGAYVSEKEIQRLTKFWIRQGKPQYDDRVLQDPPSKVEMEDFQDEMYGEAVRVVLTSGQASVSHLQRRLRLGYGRAARLMDRMEAEGIVGPADGARPREILVPTDYLERFQPSQ